MSSCGWILLQKENLRAAAKFCSAYFVKFVKHDKIISYAARLQKAAAPQHPTFEMVPSIDEYPFWCKYQMFWSE